ncbi:MAG TPA: futalosine hydrolase [Vicinamibacterales bacterium]|jgi:futalosine hydrolase
MQILVVAATAMEVAPLVARLGTARSRDSRTRSFGFCGHQVDILATGVGMVSASAWTSRALAGGHYDIAVNVGICGSFDSAFGPGAVVNVVTDRISELGAEDGDGFLHFDALNLPDEGLEGPKPACVHAKPFDNPALAALPAVSAITVNTVHGREQSIADTVARFRPQTESMEGAGFMFACAINGLRFAQVRSVSNMVERRNRSAWRIPEALASLTPAVVRILETL